MKVGSTTVAQGFAHSCRPARPTYSRALLNAPIYATEALVVLALVDVDNRNL